MVKNESGKGPPSPPPDDYTETAAPHTLVFCFDKPDYTIRPARLICLQEWPPPPAPPPG